MGLTGQNTGQHSYLVSFCYGFRESRESRSLPGLFEPAAQGSGLSCFMVPNYLPLDVDKLFFALRLLAT